MSFILNMALTKIKAAIQVKAKENGIPETDLYLMIYPKDPELNPGFRIFHRTRPIKEISFSEIIGVKSILGFDLEKEGEKWVRKFLVMSAKDKGLTFGHHFYFLRLQKNGALQAYLYIDNIPSSEISLQYILSTT